MGLRRVSDFGSNMLSGFDRCDGELTLAVSIAVIVFGYLGLTMGPRALVLLAMVCAAVGLFLSVRDWKDLRHLVSQDEDGFIVLSVGYGLFVCVGGFAISLLGLLGAVIGQPRD